MAKIGGSGKSLFSWDVDVSRAFKGAKKGEAIITMREPTSGEYMQMAKLTQAGDDGVVDVVVGLIEKTTIEGDDNKPVNVEWLRGFVKTNGTLYLLLYQQWQKMLPFDSPLARGGV